MGRCGSWVFLACALFDATTGLAMPQADRVIVLEIRADGPSGGDHQQWSELLAEVGADRVRIVSEGFGRPSVDESEFQGQTIVRVMGVLGRDGKLQLPGGTFSLRDAGPLRGFIGELRADGAHVALAEKMAFGLTAEQLVDLSQSLATKVEIETKNVRIGEFVTRLVRESPVSIVVDDSARSALASSEVIADEMQGLALGTVLAASIRPLGLVVVPARPVGRSIELRIADSRAAQEHWPIGWPLQQTPGKTAPRLFDRINFELSRAPLLDALAAIQKKVDVPMLFDQNSLAAEGADPSQVRVNFNKKKQTYYGAIDDLLSQSRPRLKLELRVDEAMQPFLWISAGR